MNDIDLNALEATARAATPGPWVLDNSGWSKPYDIPDRIAGGVTDDDWTNVIMPQDEQGGGSWSRDEDAKYIAAFDPPTTLALTARLREAEQAMTELTKDEEVTVEGFIFRWSELPDVLARNMRAVTEAQQEAKRWVIRAEDDRARLREAEAVIEEASTTIGKVNEWDGHGRADQLDNTRAILSRYKTTKTEGNER